MNRLLKLILFSVFAFTQSSCVISQNPNSAAIDPAYLQDAKVTTINVPLFFVKPFLYKEFKKEEEGELMRQTMRKIKKVKITIVQLDQENRTVKGDLSNALKVNKSFLPWLTVRNEGNKVDVLVQEKNGAIRNMYINTIGNDGGNAVFVNIKGKFTPDDISSLIKMSEKID